MKNHKVILPNNWRGFPIYLSTITTTEDNKYFRNGDIIALADFEDTNPFNHIKTGDFLLSTSISDEFIGHIFRYEQEITKNGILHHFIPTSKFLNAKKITVNKLSDISIKSKILFLVHKLSEDITFSQYEE